MQTQLDHLVFASETLDQGSDWLRERLGAETQPGGKHLAMGTHNRLLKLGPRVYLELLAIDPEGASPAGPRWLGLDDIDVRARRRERPFLLTWVARTDDLQSAVVRVPALGQIRAFARDQFRWELAVASDCGLLYGGALPALIRWQGTSHPCDHLENRGCELRSLTLQHPEAEALKQTLHELGLNAPAIVLRKGPERRSALIQSPRGEIELS
jgi:Glyoxalase-like domain